MFLEGYKAKRRFLLWGLLSAVVVLGIGLRLMHRPAPAVAPPPPPPAAPAMPPPSLRVRPEPETFKLGSHRPRTRETATCDPVDLGTFSPGRDLVHVNDERVWWESDHDAPSEDEDDHSVYHTLEPPLRRLIELVAERGATLKVQDAYRPTGIHNPRSLHKEGRAIDLTCIDMDLEDLAKLCWAAGFDWVYYERGNRSNGPHLHCSMKR